MEIFLRQVNASGVGTRLSRRKRNSPFMLTETTKTKRGRKSKEEVTKVNFRTGTLLLYRGENPRAVFMLRF